MQYALVTGGVPVLLAPGQSFTVGDVHYPANVLQLWSVEELAAIGVYPVTDTEIPEGKRSVSSSLAFDGTTVWRVHETVDMTADELDPAPFEVSPLQFRKALRASGLKEAADALAATLSEEAQEEWEYCVSVQRTNPFVVQAATALGKSDAELRALFRLAASFT